MIATCLGGNQFCARQRRDDIACVPGRYRPKRRYVLHLCPASAALLASATFYAQALLLPPAAENTTPIRQVRQRKEQFRSITLSSICILEHRGEAGLLAVWRQCAAR
jgi:hypothetical protein